MNNELNRRVQSIHHLESPAPEANSPIAYSANKVDTSVIMRCLRQGSPSSPALRYGNTSLKVVDDDVLVMDGVLVTTGASSASFLPNSLRKSELCRSWEDHGQCRYGSKCQYAHGKEEVRPTNHLFKKTEPLTLKCFNVECPPLHAIKYRFPLQPTNDGAEAITQMSNDTSSSSFRGDLWSPIDDCIEVSLLNEAEYSASREEVSEHISNVLYGQSTNRRLPVFTEVDNY